MDIKSIIKVGGNNTPILGVNRDAKQIIKNYKMTH